MSNNCIGKITLDIAETCATPNVGGYTGRGVLLQWADNPIITVDAENNRILGSISLPEGASPILIDNVSFMNPFTGSNTAGNTDDGRRKVLKTAVIKVPLRGANASKNLLEGMFVGNFEGQGAILILEKQFKSGDGSYEVVGYESPFLINPDGITRDEYADGGAYILTGSTKEIGIEYTLFDEDFATTKTLVEELYNGTEEEVDPVPGTITIDPVTQEFIAAGGDKEITVTASSTYEILDNPEWITAVTAGNIVTLTAEANATTTRNGEVIFILTSDPNVTATLTVTQLGGE